MIAMLLSFMERKTRYTSFQKSFIPPDLQKQALTCLSIIPGAPSNQAVFIASSEHPLMPVKLKPGISSLPPSAPFNTYI
ncbi:hypothetical protein [Nitrosospira sp. Nsp11]|uniref:hypothetical protein n=1 Tax=Nitrosospira sp. Nsp11 TaxID=1855338 RepID=UPI000932CF91|nr:hypothetical protein [Nitrosospira sp. Nsp11]